MQSLEELGTDKLAWIRLGFIQRLPALNRWRGAEDLPALGVNGHVLVIWLRLLRLGCGKSHQDREGQKAESSLHVNYCEEVRAVQSFRGVLLDWPWLPGFQLLRCRPGVIFQKAWHLVLAWNVWCAAWAPPQPCGVQREPRWRHTSCLYRLYHLYRLYCLYRCTGALATLGLSIINFSNFYLQQTCSGNIPMRGLLEEMSINTGFIHYLCNTTFMSIDSC